MTLQARKIYRDILHYSVYNVIFRMHMLEREKKNMFNIYFKLNYEM